MRLTNEQIKNIRRTYKISGSTAWHHEWVGDLLDTISALESELALNQAAIVREAAALVLTMAKGRNFLPSRRECADAILALSADQPALARHDAELKAQFAAVMEKAAEACGASDGWDMHPKDYARLVRALASPVSEQAGAPEETSK